MTVFRLFPLRFTFCAFGTIRFPQNKATNLLRGAWGTTFERLASDEGSSLLLRRNYERVFGPRKSNELRPLVLRASHLDGVAIERGGRFHLDVHLFDTTPSARGTIEALSCVFAAMAASGIGPERSRSELLSVTRIDNGLATDASQLPLELDLQATDEEIPTRVMITFRTPTELKSEGVIAERPEFGILFRRIYERVLALHTQYGEGEPLGSDRKGAGKVDGKRLCERAGDVRLERAALEHVTAVRRSSRTGLVHPIGGWVGEAEYRGELREFLPWLRAAEWTGVGRQTMWGKGDVRVSE